MSHCETPGLMPIEQALAQQNERVHPITETEDVALAQAYGRIIAQDITASINVPGIDNSAMDGFALKAHESNKPLSIVAQVFAGHPYKKTLQEGETVRIMTGAPVPEGADAVIMQEDTVVNDGVLTCKAEVDKGQCIRKAGEDIRSGSVVVARGTRLTAAHLSLLASIGIANVSTFRKLKIAVIATGDELVLPGNQINDGEIYESNRTGLMAMLQKLPVEIIDLGIVKDDLEATRSAFQNASKQCDWIISSGGVSVGDADFVKQVLDEIGEVSFWKVAIKPGKPYAFGRLGTACFSGLPGNPVSSFVTFAQLVLPSLQIMSGANWIEPQTYKAVLQGSIKRRAGRMEFQRAKMWNDENGMLQVTPKGKQGSGIMNSFTNANCFLVIPADVSCIDNGEFVRVQPLENFL